MAGITLTDTQINDLLAISKNIENPRARRRQEGKHWRRDYQLLSADGKHQFALFTRQSTVIHDSFSAGLRWLPKGGEPVTLMRCNGAGHAHVNYLEHERLNFVCHIHEATERYIVEGRKDEGYAIATNIYSTLDGALNHLVRRCNISGLKTERDQPELFNS